MFIKRSKYSIDFTYLYFFNHIKLIYSLEADSQYQEHSQPRFQAEALEASAGAPDSTDDNNQNEWVDGVRNTVAEFVCCRSSKSVADNDNFSNGKEHIRKETASAMQSQRCSYNNRYLQQANNYCTMQYMTPQLIKNIRRFRQT